MDSDSISTLFSGIQTSPVSAGSAIALAVTAFLLFMSAMISASEIAFFSLSPNDRNKLENSETARDMQVVSLLQIPDRVLATILIWNNFVNVGVVVLSTYAFNQMLKFDNAPLLGFLFETVILTFLILLCGEILPKVYAQSNPLKFARMIVPYLNGAVKLSRPVSTPLMGSSRFVNHISKKKTNDISANELSKALELTQGDLSEEKEMLEGIIGLYNKTVSEIMTSRMDIADLDIKTGFHDVLKYVVEVGYSRIPVYEGTQDNIKGILYIKDLLKYLDRPADYKWKDLIKPAYFVPENKKIDDLMEEFRKVKIHLAVVVDEFGGTSGIVTMEDILEEIVGEINDEYDDDELLFTRNDDGSYIFDAKILLTDFFRETEIDPKTFGKLTDEVDTLAGLLLEIKGNFPVKDEIITCEKYKFQILDVDNKRILKVKFTPDNEG